MSDVEKQKRPEIKSTRPVSLQLENVLRAAGAAAGIDSVVIVDPDPVAPGSVQTGTAVNDGQLSADIRLVFGNETLSFWQDQTGEKLRRFIVAAAANGATGIGAGEDYLGTSTMRVGFGRFGGDTRRAVWGRDGQSRNAPVWLREAASEGWEDPPDWALVSGVPRQTGVPPVGKDPDLDSNQMVLKAAQKRLSDLGYKLGSIDGVMQTLTRGALLAFQYDNALTLTGRLDTATLDRLSTAAGRALEVQRTSATEETLVKQGSEITREARKGRMLGWITAAFGALGAGNSTIVNTSNSTAGAAPDVEPLLAALKDVAAGTTPDQSARLAEVLGRIPGLGDGKSGREIADLVQLVLTSSDPAATSDALGRILTDRANASLTTVVDLLPGLFAPGSTPEEIAQMIAGLASSLLPNFAGSVAIIGIGLFGRQIANRISAQRVRDHRSGGNVNPLKSSADAEAQP